MTGQLVEFYVTIRDEFPGWSVGAEGDRETLCRTVEKNGLTCAVKVEAHGSSHFKFEAAMHSGGSVQVERRPCPGSSSENLGKCLTAAISMAEKMLTE